jgi:exopolysaccharide biosynthesis protein
MKKYFLISLAILQFCCTSQQKSNNSIAPQLNKMRWSKEVIHPSIVWKWHHFKNLFNAKQYVNVLDINLNDTLIKIDIGFQKPALLTTHEIAEREKGLVAINGNFFHTEEGGSVCFFKKDGNIIDTSRTDLTERLFLPWLDDAAIALTKEQRIKIVNEPVEGWRAIDSLPTIFTGGPFLIQNGEEVKQAAHSFNNNRFGRTGAGLTNDGHLILVVVDGNSAESAGMSIKESAQLFKSLGCTVAFNLDGGGSSTMWIKGQPDNGIVNHPTDNKKFDHYGERKVANALIIKLK